MEQKKFKTYWNTEDEADQLLQLMENFSSNTEYTVKTTKTKLENGSFLVSCIFDKDFIEEEN